MLNVFVRRFCMGQILIDWEDIHLVSAFRNDWGHLDGEALFLEKEAEGSYNYHAPLLSCPGYTKEKYGPNTCQMFAARR